MSADGNTQVGGIKAILTLDKSDYTAGLQDAARQADDLGRHSPNIHVSVDDAAALAKLDALTTANGTLRQAQERTIVAQLRLNEAEASGSTSASRLAVAKIALAAAQSHEAEETAKAAAAEDADATASRRATDAALVQAGAVGALARAHNDNADAATKDSAATRDNTRGNGALLTSIVALGPAIVPISAASAGAGAALTAMGLSGVLAVAGIKQEMKEGTALGVQYSAGVRTIKEDLSSLESVAAAGILTPFRTEVAALHADMPRLSGVVAEFSGITGRTAANLTSGLVAVFFQLEPLARDVGVYIQSLSARFDDLAHGSGVKDFGDYARSVFPQVASTIENLVQTAGRLIVALAPLGGGVVTAINAVSTAINAIPIPILTALATVGPSIFLGFKAYGIVSSAAEAVKGFAVAEGIAAGASRGLALAAGPVGIALGVLTLALSYQANQAAANQAAINDYADALRESNGVIDESIRSTVAKKLADEGALDAAKTLGINLGTLTSAVLGNGEAMDSVKASVHAANQEYASNVGTADENADSQGKLADAMHSVNDVVNDQSGAFAAAVQRNQDLAAATQSATGEATAQSQAHSAVATTLGTTVSALAAAAAAQTQHTIQAAAATLQMQYENDAAGLLKQSLDALSGKALSAAQAQSTFDQATLSLSSSVRDAKGNIDASKTAVEGSSAAAVQNRSSLLQLVTAANGVAEATANQTGSTEAGRQKLAQMRAEIVNNATANGLNRDQVQAFIDKVLAIPKSVPPTKITVDTALANSALSHTRAILESLQSRTITVTTHQATVIDSGAYAGKQVSTNASGSLTLGSGVQPFAAAATAVRTMADGGVGRDGMIMRSQSPILWNEAPGGEAYIPLAPARRARSTQILAATNDALGNPLGVGGGSGASASAIGAAVASALAGVAFTGTFESPWGPVQVTSQIQTAITAQARQITYGRR